MERVYKSEEESKVATFFTGIEVEKTTTEGLKTLFVVGIQDAEQIYNLARQEHVQHIYFGANQSCKPASTEEWNEWNDMIFALLDKNYWVTVDFDVSFIAGFLQCDCASHHRLIPMVSVKIPHVRLCNHNTIIKIDDVGFNATNPGVWCNSLTNLTSFKVLTTWEQYGNDKLIV